MIDTSNKITNLKEDLFKKSKSIGSINTSKKIKEI